MEVIYKEVNSMVMYSRSGRAYIVQGRLIPVGRRGGFRRYPMRRF